MTNDRTATAARFFDLAVNRQGAVGKVGRCDRTHVQSDGDHDVAVHCDGRTQVSNHFAQDPNVNCGRYCVLEDAWARDKRAEGRRPSESYRGSGVLT